jgi:hypothetical protein
MKLSSIKRPTPAMAVAVGALVVALSGSAAVASGALQNGNKLIAKNTLSGNRLKNNSVTGKQINAGTLGTVPVATSLAPLVWNNLTLVNGWVNYPTGLLLLGGYAPPQYAIDGQGFVHLRGGLSGASKTSGVIASLPSGFRPAAGNTWLPVASTNGSSDPQTADIDVTSAGNITAYAGSGATLKFVSLDGVEFYAG